MAILFGTPTTAVARDAEPAGEPAARGTADLPAQLQTGDQTSAYGMVACSVPDASRVGARVLEEGGNAVDAAVATAFAVGVCDPFFSGIGGMAYVVIHLNNGEDVAIDAPPRVPIRAVPDELETLKERNTLYGYKTIVAPTMPAVLAFALKRYGTMTLARVLAPAIDLAEYGHTFLPLAQEEVEAATPLGKTRQNEFLSRTFLRDGWDAWPLGHVYCQPVLAATLRRLVSHGVADFYLGEIGAAMTTDILANGGYVSRSDLALVRPVQLTPTRGRYRGLDVVSFPFPGGGDIVVDALNILDRFPPGLLREDSLDRVHVLLEAERLSMIVAEERLASPRLRRGALDPVSSGRKAALIRLDRALYPHEIVAAPPRSFSEHDTTQVSVIDRFGNAVSMTLSIGNGSHVATPTLGFQYNSLLESSEFLDARSPLYLSPLKTLPTTMAPTILLCKGAPFLVLGSPASGRIPAIIVSVINNVVDRELSLRDAVAAPRVLYSVPNEDYRESIFIEIAGTMTSARADELKTRGFAGQNRLTFPAAQEDLYPFGGVNAVMLDSATGMFVGVGDQRRQGAAAGPAHP